MTREILFRGKRIDNGEWVYGDLRQYSEKCIGIYDYELRQTVKGVDPSTIGQFTGLTDKNDKKIFEGDIIDASDTWWNACGPAGHDSPIIPVEWDENNCGFSPFANYDCDCGVYIVAWQCEVIGNIHDNPELLEGEG